MQQPLRADWATLSILEDVKHTDKTKISHPHKGQETILKQHDKVSQRTEGEKKWPDLHSVLLESTFLDLSSFHKRTKHIEIYCTYGNFQINPSPRSTCPTSLHRQWYHQIPTIRGYARSNVCVPHITPISCQCQYHTIP
jgi:hypothetical protein